MSLLHVLTLIVLKLTQMILFSLRGESDAHISYKKYPPLDVLPFLLLLQINHVHQNLFISFNEQNYS